MDREVLGSNHQLAYGTAGLSASDGQATLMSLFLKAVLKAVPYPEASLVSEGLFRILTT